MATKQRPTRKAAKAAPRSKGKKPSTSSKGDTRVTAKRLEDYLRVHAQHMLDDPNITSVGVGYKAVPGKNRVLAIQFTVADDVVPQALGAPQIPQSIKVGGVDVPTEVTKRSFRPAYLRRDAKVKDVRRARADTLQPGMSVGGVFSGGGSIGCFVRDRQTGRLVILSNWHVLHGPAGSLGNDVVQPGKKDDDRVAHNRIGELLRSHLGAAGDCAIASVGGRGISNVPVELVSVTIDAIGRPELGDRVVKSGRTTGVTYGLVTRVGVNTRIPYGGGITEVIGGFEVGPDPQHPAPENEISRPGDSGSAWLAVDQKGNPTGVMLGLHFAGDQDGTVSEIALACYAESVMNKLEIEPLDTVQPQKLGDDDSLRAGFDRGFLPFAVDVAGFTPTRKTDLAKLDGREEVPYCHFSVWLSKKRKYPLCVAWNIDGAAFVKLPRKSFRTERRGTLENHQLTDAIYKFNPFDKGHIARRADVCWGSKDEAELGNFDSFYFTNIAPQHESFNQSGNTDFDTEGGVWGRLENTIFDSEAPHDLKVSLLGGPVFGPDDPTFEQGGESCRIPKSFWKVVCFVDDADNKEKVFGFYLTQAELIEDLVGPEGIDLSEWVWARITLTDLEAETGVRFAQAMHQREVTFVAPQGLATGLRLKPIHSRVNYFRS